MKKTISIVILLLIFLRLNAQFSEKNAIYVTGEFNMGNFLGMNLNLNYILDNKYSFQAGFLGLLSDSKSKPDDFSTGVISGIFTLGLSGIHLDEMESYYVLVGKIFKSNNRNFVRFNLATGIGYTVISAPTNWRRTNDYPWGDNYTCDKVEHGTISLIINPKVEFPLLQFIGLTVSPMLLINKDRTYVGLGIGAMVGILREKQNTSF